MRALPLILLAMTLGQDSPAATAASPPPPSFDPRIRDIVDSISAERIEADIRKLAGFGTRHTMSETGTRHTMSETESDTRGIGAARRWIQAEFERISEDCGGCLEVSSQATLVEADGRRIKRDTRVVNVIAILRGTTDPNRYVIMSGDIDSRASDALDDTSAAPGANDNASGMAGTIEAARSLSEYRFPASIVFAGLSGEEQGLFGGQHMAQMARREGWIIEGVLNNDMIANVEGIDGITANDTFRVFSEPTPVTETEEARRRRRFTGGEVDGPSRQLARYVARVSELYVPNLDAIMIYRLDRFGRGGHHRPFNDEGFPAVRIMVPGRAYHGDPRELQSATSRHPGGEHHH